MKRMVTIDIDCGDVTCDNCDRRALDRCDIFGLLFPMDRVGPYERHPSCVGAERAADSTPSGTPTD